MLLISSFPLNVKLLISNSKLNVEFGIKFLLIVKDDFSFDNKNKSFEKFFLFGIGFSNFVLILLNDFLFAKVFEGRRALSNSFKLKNIFSNRNKYPITFSFIFTSLKTNVK